ncbi:BadF/BadG/BcrA/BcrD ATPase family protein [Kitasatospora sp. MAP5-34]|uniref:BadF/BadG/BcrA/BcrD ATPase family protein n=1 Tax=Kitasatospora sp. MAP5-34 TaxID=3035102 RepID=UPI002475BD99|nr:BadF/BadG/BcrA/BcrD ATPase family protein [Kitasatospora sp. MAP5-34]MDH6579147.1 N-acetylglucosamine kinase-like BadF-type ATPase [Kitasatospora sp. MAP5-34]
MRYWAIDAGGSTTTALLDDGTRWRAGSVNPASVGARAADRGLLDLLRAVGSRLDGQPAAGWLATAALDADAPQRELDRLTRPAGTAGLTGTLVVSRDILPLLLAPPLRGRGVAVVCGTGSGFLAGDGVRTPRAIGGCEYLGSDEGSAFALGLGGLRAAVRGADGRGAPTALGPAIAEHADVSAPELARRLAGQPYPKASVAALSVVVCRCWLAGDPVAGQVVGAALDELLHGVRTARDSMGLTGQWSATLAGGVFRGCPEFADALRMRITEELGADSPPTVVDDPAAAVLAALREHAGGLPAAVAGRWAWTHRSTHNSTRKWSHEWTHEWAHTRDDAGREHAALAAAEERPG